MPASGVLYPDDNAMSGYHCDDWMVMMALRTGSPRFALGALGLPTCQGSKTPSICGLSAIFQLYAEPMQSPGQKMRWMQRDYLLV